MIDKKYSFKLISKKTLKEIKGGVKSTDTKTKKTILKKKSFSSKKITKTNENIDNGKRLFLHLAGVAGLGFVAAALFPTKEAEAYVTGSTPTSNIVGSKNIANVRINPATEDTLATIKTNTDPLVASGAGGYVRQDSTATIAKETGGNLDIIAANIPAKGQSTMSASTPVVISSDQTPIPVSGSFSVDSVGIKDTTNTIINPSTDDSVILLRRIVKLMESQATVDLGNRQRVTIDSLGSLGATMPVSGSLTTAGTVSTVSTVSAITTFLGQNQQAFQDVARNAYANGIRNNLTFS